MPDFETIWCPYSEWLNSAAVVPCHPSESAPAPEQENGFPRVRARFLERTINWHPLA